MTHLAPLHPTHPTEPTPIGTALDVEYIARRVAASRPSLEVVEWDDDRPGMMRVHIAQERALALCEKFQRDELRKLARSKGIASGRKYDMALALALKGVKA